MSQHTPGPWVAKRAEIYRDRCIAQNRDYSYVASAGNEADARLIAAAPEMLALLEYVPHNQQTALHKMIGTVAGCPGCAASALLASLQPDTERKG